MGGERTGKAPGPEHHGALGRGADTQWPRWLVFKQDDEAKPHKAVGSVHAVGAEHALLMARSVFARRPSAVSLWVAPEAAVTSATSEQLAAEARDPSLAPDVGQPQRYRVFRKTGHRRAMTFVEDVGEVEASGAGSAMRLATERFADPEAVAWWVVPTAGLSASPEQEVAAWFEPGRDKDYKQQSRYATVHAPGAKRGSAS